MLHSRSALPPARIRGKLEAHEQMNRSWPMARPAVGTLQSPRPSRRFHRRQWQNLPLLSGKQRQRENVAYLRNGNSLAWQTNPIWFNRRLLRSGSRAGSRICSRNCFSDAAETCRHPTSPNTRTPAARAASASFPIKRRQHRRPPHRQLQVRGVIGRSILECATRGHQLQLGLSARRDRVLSNLPQSQTSPKLGCIVDSNQLR